jgi:hypothetical protein
VPTRRGRCQQALEQWHRRLLGKVTDDIVKPTAAAARGIPDGCTVES